jgi:integrase
MFNRGVKAGWLPSGLSPFDSAESIKLPHRPLLESDLPTDIEVHALLSLSDPFMADIIRLYYATGARTHELIEARVIDFQPKTHAIVLGRHKRSQTMKDPVPRTITLNDTAFAILQRRCEGRSPDDHVIINRKGNPYDSRDIAQLFAVARKRGGVRSSITIYSFRHLWISEMLMAGVDVLLVARMAGTSVAMVERVYGHFRNQSYQDAQARLDKDRGLRGV